MRFLLLLTSLIFLNSCATPEPAVLQSKHYAEGEFKDNHSDARGGSFFTWQWQRLRDGLPKAAPAGGWQFPVTKPDVAFLKSNRSVTTVTWLGHASVLLQVGGVNILLDPHFSERASPVSLVGPKRVTPPPLSYTELPHIDAVLTSHNHYDHLDAATVDSLNQQAGGPPLYLAGLGMKPWFAGLGINNMQALDWWQSVAIKGVRIHFTPVQHWSKRSLTDTNQSLWGSYVVETADFRFFFAGDTGYSPDFAEIGRRFAGGFDLAAIPIGAYAPRWFMKGAHVDPSESLKIMRDIGARQALAIHWGTFVLTDEPLDEPPQLLAAELSKAGMAADSFWVLPQGETRRFHR
jgi:N-acyl-phosphatidylethanolamine-hydrolysing phospholipase D